MRRQKMSAIFKRTWDRALGGDKVQFVKFNALVHRNWKIVGSRFSTAMVMLVTKFKPWWHFLNMSSKSRKFVTEIIGDWHLLPKLICCPTINVGSCWISLKLEFWKKSKSKVNWPFARLKSCSRVELETVLSLVGFQTDSDWSVLLANQRSSWN